MINEEETPNSNSKDPEILEVTQSESQGANLPKASESEPEVSSGEEESEHINGETVGEPESSAKETKATSENTNGVSEPDKETQKNQGTEIPSEKKSQSANKNKFKFSDYEKSSDKLGSGGESEEENSNYDSYIFVNPERLKEKLDRIQNDICELNKEEQILKNKIKNVKEDFYDAIDPSHKQNYKQRRNKLEEELESVREKLDKFYEIESSIQNEIEEVKFKRRNRPKDKSGVNKASQTIADSSVEELFKNGQPIENVVLYVGTFFPDISVGDFERVVSYLLEGRKMSVPVESTITTETGEVKKIEQLEEKSLLELWQESLEQPDKYLASCHLSSLLLEDGSQVMGFYVPELEKKLKKYFKEDQALYLGKQFERARFLLFDSSPKVVENAISLSLDMAISSPSSSWEDWLVEIIKDFAKLDGNISSQKLPKPMEFLAKYSQNQRRAFIFSVVSSLSSEMLSNLQLEEVVKSFLEKLISAKRYDGVMEIVKRWQYALKSDILYWTRQLLDRGDESIRWKAYKFLYNQLNQSHSRIYQLLNSINEWLPKPELTPDKYSPSNKLALLLSFDYCLNTTKEIELEYYGCWPSQHPLFSSLKSLSDDNESENLVDSNLATLASWLFHPGIIDVVENNVDIDFMLWISLLIVEWSKILAPEEKWFTLNELEKKEPNEEASNMFKNLLKQIILNSSQEQQKKLTLFWDYLAEVYLKTVKDCEEKGERKLKRLTSYQRNIVRRVRKQFKALQKTTLLAK